MTEANNLTDTSTQATPKRSFKKVAAIFVSGSVIALMLQIISGFLTQMIVSPAVMGLFNSINTLGLTTLAFLQLGAIHGLNREYPYNIGLGKREYAIDLAATLQTWTFIIGGLVSLGMVGFSVYYFWQGQIEQGFGWLTNVPLALFMFYKLYLQSLYRSNDDFPRLTLIVVLVHVILLVGTLFVYFFHYYGLILRVLLIGLLQIWMLYKWRPVKVPFRFEFQNLIHLAKVGLPIFFSEIMYVWWTITVYCWVVLGSTSTEMYGKFSLALNAWQVMNISDMLRLVLFPKMSERLGKSDDPETVIRMAVKTVPYLLGINVAIVTTAWFAIPPLVHLVLPRYADAVPATQWTLLVLLLSSFQPLVTALNVLKQKRLYLLSMSTGFASTYLVIYWLNRNGVELVHFPQGLLIGHAIFTFSNIIIIAWLRHKVRSSKLQ